MESRIIDQLEIYKEGMESITSKHDYKIIIATLDDLNHPKALANLFAYAHKIQQGKKRVQKICRETMVKIEEKILQYGSDCLYYRYLMYKHQFMSA